MSQIIELKGSDVLCMKNTMCEVVSKVDDPGVPIVARVSTESIDSDGDIVHQGKTKHGAGWLLKRFNNAPVMVWSHDIWMPNLSSALTRAKVGPDATYGRSLFLDPAVFDEGDPFAMQLDGKVRRGVLKEWSVSFIGKIWEMIRDKENDRVTGREFFEQELIETSPVNRGANPDTDAVAKRLLGDAYVTSKIVDTADAEFAEGLDEIEDLKAQIGVLSTALKGMGDQVSACVDAVAMIKEERNKQGDELKVVAGDMLSRLRKLGVVHE